MTPVSLRMAVIFKDVYRGHPGRMAVAPRRNFAKHTGVHLETICSNMHIMWLPHAALLANELQINIM